MENEQEEKDIDRTEKGKNLVVELTMDKFTEEDFKSN